MRRPRRRGATGLKDVRPSVLALVLFVGCGRAPPSPTPSPPADPPRVSSAAAPRTPPPGALVEAAGAYGLSPGDEGWTWTPMDEKATRFAWAGRPASNDREVLVSFWMELDATTSKLVPQLVSSAASNLADGAPCRPFDQPREIVDVLGVERVVTVCFTPSTFYRRGFSQGVVHGIVAKERLTILVALSNERNAVVPLESAIGMRAAPR